MRYRVGPLAGGLLSIILVVAALGCGDGTPGTARAPTATLESVTIPETSAPAAGVEEES